jgi:hypothetical protein
MARSGSYEENMDWPSYLRKLVSTTAGTAAGAAAGAAATPGGPIAMAAASVAARKVSDDLLAQFMGAHADQMQRIEEISLEMRGQLIELQNTVGGLLDAPWRTALAHIEEAGRRPSRRAQELELARIRLFDAWGVSKSLLERDPRSLDPAALRCPLVAQQIAAVYSLLGERQNAMNWLVTAYKTSRNQLNDQVGAVYDIFAEKMRGVKKRIDFGFIMISVYSADPNSQDPLWVRAPLPDHDLRSGPYEGGKFWRKFGLVKPDLGFEGRLAALGALDAEAALLRLACLDAGVEGVALMPGVHPRLAGMYSAREGERRALIEDRSRAYTSFVDHQANVLVVFDATTAVVAHVGTTARDSPIYHVIGDRYREVLPVQISPNFYRSA